MKRKSSKKSENATEEKNGDVENSEEPLEKKGRGTRGRPKEKQATNNEEGSKDEAGSQSSDSPDTVPKQNGKQKKKGRQAKGKKGNEIIEEQEETGSQSSEKQEADIPQKKKGKSQIPKQKKKGKKAKVKKGKEVNEEEGGSENETDSLCDGDDDDAEYEVEQVVGEKTMKGVRHFLIRWKGYTKESDTWEPEDSLTCNDLIKAFKNKHKSLKQETAKANKGNTKGKKPGKEQKEDSEDPSDKNDDLKVKTFECEVCHKKVGRIDTLNRHVLTHSVEKPIKCAFCKKTFIRQIQLFMHLDASHSKANEKAKAKRRLGRSRRL